MFLLILDVISFQLLVALPPLYKKEVYSVLIIMRVMIIMKIMIIMTIIIVIIIIIPYFLLLCRWHQ